MFLQKAGLRHYYVIQNTNIFSITLLQKISLQMQENRPVILPVTPKSKSESGKGQTETQKKNGRERVCAAPSYNSEHIPYSSRAKQLTLRYSRAFSRSNYMHNVELGGNVTANEERVRF